ncbi:hypothetical protein B0J13DRAFT_659448 [Dactylonectria estremocensis]|uniref:NmrA-like domain-containing protein n=1 Tax=Dactylonectria estremocensis TaxID=1079267 RepID=A0A9P9I8H4_9HYPO|nr:hypothetical protein B0J13DRAFT_659448 [Dactylonectria estremocensis]
MVKIAVAGGSGEVGQEVVDALAAPKKHDILILSRKDAPPGDVRPGVSWVKVNYEDRDQLTEILRGVHTVLSFIVVHWDPGSIAQKTLIDAAIAAGVKRFAPSEWGSSGLTDLPMYLGKAEVREYLKELNREKKVLEYTLFQQGIFLNYFASPFKTAKHLTPLNLFIDLQNRRAILLKGHEEDSLTLTTVQDLARVVSRAVEYEEEWPVIGGITGNKVTIGQLLALGEKLRGKPLETEKVHLEDIEAGVIKTSWVPQFRHPSIPQDQIDATSKHALIALLLSISKGGWITSDEWNRLLPDCKFTAIEEFLSDVWSGTP